jgi:probable F420-dependent oxidoreductase
MVLSENWTLVDPRDLAALVEVAVMAEAAGIDAVMVSEHVALGGGSGSAGMPGNPRDYALPGNQPADFPWPDSLTVLAAVAQATTTLRLVAGAIIAPLRHPVLLAKQLATVDLLSRGRLVVLPTVSWHEAEYTGLGVDFHRRGELLDEHLACWGPLWTGRPVSHHGDHYRFDDLCVSPAPHRTGGPPLWFGSDRVHRRLLARLARYGSGYNPLGPLADGDLERIDAALAEAGRSRAELEMVGGIRGTFAGPDDVADLDHALAGVPAQRELGMTTMCFKPSMFTDRVDELADLFAQVVSYEALP